jgi:hypothetical protein
MKEIIQYVIKQMKSHKRKKVQMFLPVLLL